MLILIWVVALLAAVLMYLYSELSKFRKRGVKADNLYIVLKTTLRILMGREHSVDVVHKNYIKNNKQRFVGINLFGMSILQVRDVELIKKITVTDFEHFVDHRNLAAGDPLFSRNLFTLKGDEWKKMRSNLTPAFTSSKIRLMLPFVVDVGDQMVLNLEKTIKESGSEYLEVNGKDLTTRYTNDVIASFAFGLKLNSHSDRNNEFYVRGLETATLKLGQILLFMISTSFPWLTKTLKLKLFSNKTYDFFMNLVLSTIENREKNNVIRPDMIHLLMEAKKGKMKYEEQTQGANVGFATVEEAVIGKGNIKKEWEDIDLVAQAVIFFLAGFDTVSTALSFLLYELAVNPDVQDRLMIEIRETDARNGGKDYNSIQRMTYMDMVVSETMRKWPPVIALDRVCVKDYNMGKPTDEATKEYIIRKGEGLQIFLWGIHRDPEYFPNPLKFDPERFSNESKHNIKPFTYSPFGLGPRNCIASRFALCVVKVMAYQLLQHLEVSPGPRTTITSNLDPGKLTAIIEGGHWVRFKVRE